MLTLVIIIFIIICLSGGWGASYRGWFGEYYNSHGTFWLAGILIFVVLALAIR